MKPVGKPDALIGHVRFDERGWETGRRFVVSARAHPRLYKCAGINRHVVGNERVLQERRKRIHLGPEFCGWHREVLVEAQTGVSVGRAIELRKVAEQDADSLTVWRKAIWLAALYASGRLNPA